jgi:hypothetical protein
LVALNACPDRLRKPPRPDESAGDLEQIQFLLRHASIQTTERYLGSWQNLKVPVNDRLGLDFDR